MALASGARLGPYEILTLVGAGGMGEVYRARDTKLNRDVALKILPTAFALDPDRLARFKREARVLASLNHPNIAAIYGFEESNGVQTLVLELVDGPTMADRIAQGPVPLDEALPIARQIAEALEAAHEQGIIHRDLKPANIKLRPDGTVKVLDFGLAKALEPVSGIRSDVTASPTITSPAMTGRGVILGTAAYMSPEQARGKPLDRRADIWAFGCVLYELLTGRVAFAGETVSDSSAAVLGREPDWAVLPADTPARVQWLLRRCLEKDPKRRLHDIADARIEVDEALSPTADSGPVAPADRRSPVLARGRERVAWISAAASLIALVVALVVGRAGTAGPSTADTRSYRSSVLLSEGLRLAGPPAGSFALSPDGRQLAFVASDRAGHTMLWMRPLDGLTAQPLPGTEGAAHPFWSPDSRSVAFLAQGKLKKIAASGGEPFTLCDASYGATGAWNQEDVILFTPTGESPLYRVPATGGTPSPVTTLDRVSGDSQHVYPSFLPDGRRFLYLVRGSRSGGATDPRGVYVGTLASHETGKQLLEAGLNAKYAQGHVFFMRGSTLVAQALDLDRLETRGAVLPITDNTQMVSGGITGAAGAFSVSEAGVIVYQVGFDTVFSELSWFDRAGRPIAKLSDRADYNDVSLSPDGTRAAVSIVDPARGTRDIWIYDVARGLRDRFTFDPGDEFAPSWSPDGSRLVFSTRQGGSVDLHQKASSGAGREEPLLEAGLGKFQASWSPDGRLLVYAAGGSAISRSDLWILPLTGDRKPFPFLDSPLLETHGQLSPDGRWIAYSTGEAIEQLNVYVAPFPGPGPRWRVSTGGGGWPRWRRDGKELFYLTPDNTLTVANVAADGAEFRVGAVRPLFRTRPRPFARLDAYPYDVSADGQRVLVNTFVEETPSRPVTLVVNWKAGR